jgi:hypothetical protein
MTVSITPTAGFAVQFLRKTPNDAVAGGATSTVDEDGDS